MDFGTPLYLMDLNEPLPKVKQTGAPTLALLSSVPVQSAPAKPMIEAAMALEAERAAAVIKARLNCMMIIWLLQTRVLAVEKFACRRRCSYLVSEELEAEEQERNKRAYLYVLE